jgi:hypothetical protein
VCDGDDSTSDEHDVSESDDQPLRQIARRSTQNASDSDIDQTSQLIPYDIRDQRRSTRSLGNVIMYLVFWADADGDCIEDDPSWEVASTYDDDPEFAALVQDWKDSRPPRFNTAKWLK